MDIKKMSWAVVAAALGAVITLSATVSASHHFESMTSQGNPALDLLDVYVFPSERLGFTAFVANVNPDVQPADASPFADDGLYSIHIGQDKALSNGITLTVQFAGIKGRIGLVQGANEGVGSRGQTIGEFDIGQTTEVGEGLKVWAGSIHDPFMGNCVGLQRQHLSEASGTFNANAYDNKADFFESRTAGSIVVEVPNAMLGDSVYLYATTAKRRTDDWVQINRMANPLMTHLFMSFDVHNTLEHVSHRPDSDLMRSSTVSGHVLRMVTMVGSHKDDSVAYTDSVVKRLLPDLIGYTVGAETNYSAGSMGGRDLADDVMDSQLTLFWGTPMTDGANENANRRQANFPYVIPLSTLPGGKPPGFDDLPACVP